MEIFSFATKKLELVVFNDMTVSAYKSKCSFQRSSSAQCEKGEKCVNASVGSAQTLLEFAGGNRNLTNNKIFQRAHLPKSNYYSHKQVSPRGDVLCCAELSSEKPSWRAGAELGDGHSAVIPRSLL